MNKENTFKMARFLYYAGCLTISLITIHPAFSISLSDYFFFGALIAVVVEILLWNRKIELTLPVLFVLSCLCVAVGGLMALYSSHSMEDKWAGLTVVLRFVYVTILWFWLGTMVLRTEIHVKRAVKFWLLSVAVSGSVAVLQLLDPGIVLGTEPMHGRMTAFATYPNNLGAMSAVGWGAACIFFSRGGLSSNVLLRYGILICILAGLILSGSTGAALSALGATVVWFFLTRSKKQLIWVAIIVFGITIPVFTVQHMMGGKSIFHRINKTLISTTSKPTTLNMRIRDYKKVLIKTKQNPLIGVGFKPPEVRAATKTLAVHNIYLRVLYEAGFIGFFGIVALTLVSVILAKNLLARIRKIGTERHLAMALSAASVGFFLYAMTGPDLYQRYIWISLSLLLSLRAVIQRKVRYVSDNWQSS